jgi:hypothetical protein
VWEGVGVEFPSTTQILKEFGFYSYLDHAGAVNSEVGKHRGSAVDKAVTWLATGKEPPWKQAHPELDGYLDGFRKFLGDHSWVHASHQDEFICQEERFVSHPDLLGELDGKLAVLEVKTGAFPQFVRLQTALQVIAERNRMRRRFCITLAGDGKYKLTPLNDPRDFNAGIILVRAWWVRAEFGLVGEGS